MADLASRLRAAANRCARVNSDVALLCERALDAAMYLDRMNQRHVSYVCPVCAASLQGTEDDWLWLIGKKLSLGEVIDVCGETATVCHGDEETRILIGELLREDYKARKRADQQFNQALNEGDGIYRP